MTLQYDRLLEKTRTSISKKELHNFALALLRFARKNASRTSFRMSTMTKEAVGDAMSICQEFTDEEIKDANESLKEAIENNDDWDDSAKYAIFFKEYDRRRKLFNDSRTKSLNELCYQNQLKYTYSVTEALSKELSTGVHLYDLYLFGPKELNYTCIFPLSSIAYNFIATSKFDNSYTMKNIPIWPFFMEDGNYDINNTKIAFYIIDRPVIKNEKSLFSAKGFGNSKSLVIYDTVERKLSVRMASISDGVEDVILNMSLEKNQKFFQDAFDFTGTFEDYVDKILQEASITPSFFLNKEDQQTADEKRRFLAMRAF